MPHQIEPKTMTCDCKRTLHYDGYYHCYECDCGKCYNAAGQTLAPRSEWQHEYDAGTI